MLFRFLTLLLISTLVLGCSSKNTKNPVNEDVNILFCGDVMLDWGIKDIIQTEGYEYPLKELRHLLYKYDYRFCNLECPISEIGEPHPTKKYIFLAEPSALKLLKYGRIDGVSLANNHVNDFGEVALINTMTNLYNNGISFTGAGMDIGSAHLPISVEIRDIRLAIFAYSTIAYPESFSADSSPGVARADIDFIREDIKNYARYNDFIIVSIHWGREYSDFPTRHQIELAHAIIDSGVDVIIGHHPHVYQGIEIYNGKPIVYSLGNFIFGSINEDIQDNILVGIKLLKSGLYSLSVHPINGNKSTDKRFHHEPLLGEDAEHTLKHILWISELLGMEFVEKAYIKDSILTYLF
ncbi:MAG: CapA family protein [Spirochaetota bacterium]|nr:CapA family protein [Spirochaetota bacterium]